MRQYKDHLCILNSPSLPIDLLFSPQRQTRSLYPNFERFHQVHLFSNGRSAIFHAVRVLALNQSDKHILMPSYGCGADVEPVLRAGCKVKYYRIDRNMKIDIEDLEKRIRSNTGAIYVTHYNGFPQSMINIKDLWALGELKLIEDCAHVLHNGVERTQMGSFGDLAIFSMRKSLPIPDGGALAINNIDLQFDDSKLVHMDRWQTFRKTLYLIKRNLAVQRKATYGHLKDASFGAGRLLGRKPTEIEKYEPDTYKPFEVLDNSVDSYKRFDQRMSRISRWISRRINFNQIARRRRENYSYLFEALSGLSWLRPIFGELPNGVCPLFFMAAAEDPYAVYIYLLDMGIESHCYWDFFHPAIPWNEFPDAAYLKKHVLALPIHQDIGDDELKFMVEAVRGFRK